MQSHEFQKCSSCLKRGKGGGGGFNCRSVDRWLLSESIVSTTCLSAESPGWNRLSDKEMKATGLRIEGRNGKRLFFFFFSSVKMTNMSQYQNDFGIDSIGSAVA